MRLAGFALVVVSALCYSTLGLFGKIGFSEGLSVSSMMTTRFILAVLLLWGIVLVRRDLRTAAALPAPRVAGLLLWGVFGYAGQAAIFFTALQQIPASLAEVLLYTCPAFLALIIWARTGRRPAALVCAAIVLAMAGTWLASAPEAAVGSSTGVALAVLAGLWYAVFLLLLERVTPGVPAFISTAYVITGAMLGFLAALPFTGYEPPATLRAWGAVLGMVLTATLFGFALFVAGMKRTGTQVASILSTFEPLGTLVLAGLFLGERLGPGQWVGAGCILAAALILAARAGGAAGSETEIDRPGDAAIDQAVGPA